MKLFKVTSNENKSVVVKSNTKESARQIARKQLGYVMRGEFFPLHWSEIKSTIRIK